MNENLLIANFNDAKSQEEDCTTEAFASLLRYLVVSEKRNVSGLFSLLTRRKFNLNNYRHDDISINTQTRTIFGRPDIEIVAPDYLIYIENKIEAGLKNRQILRYQRDLEISDKSKTLLVLISKYRMKFPREEPDCHIRWHQIANWFQDVLHRLEHKESYIKVSQFLDFLHFRYLTTEPATKRVFPSLKKYIQRDGLKRLSFRRMNRSSELGDDRDLIPLRKLLNIMAFSIEKAFPNDGFGFSNRIFNLNGNFSGIGFNIAYQYDFFIDINEPDTLLFMTSTKGNLSSGIIPCNLNWFTLGE